MIIQLAEEWSRHCRHSGFPPGTVALGRQESADVVNRIVAAIDGLETAERAELLARTIADFTPGLVVHHPTQLTLAKSWQEEG